jgi:predicted phosphodiesterase
MLSCRRIEKLATNRRLVSDAPKELDMSEAAPLDREEVAGVTRVAARRIGVIADDHNGREDGSDLPETVLAAFAGVDLILHLGHMGVKEISGRGVLDRLTKVAPVLAVRDYVTGSDGNVFVTTPDGDRVAGLTRIVEANGVRIGLVHNLGAGPGPAIVTPPGGLPDLQGVEVESVLSEKFGGPVDVIASAGSHRAAAVCAQGTLFVNPGSPAYPKGPGRIPGATPGTAGILDVSDGVATFEVLELALFAHSA